VAFPPPNNSSPQVVLLGPAAVALSRQAEQVPVTLLTYLLAPQVQSVPFPLPLLVKPGAQVVQNVPEYPDRHLPHV
jgi:hypothetical protein